MHQFSEHKNTISLLPLLAVMALLVICFVPASAQAPAGYDLFQTGSGASVDLTSIGLGNVSLQSFPIQSSLGNTDTIMHRTKDIPANGGSSPVEVTALFMKSASSVNYKGQSVDVYVTLNNSAGAIPTTTLPQPDATSSSGSVTVRSDNTFDSSITVNADVILVKAGTSVTNSANYVAHQGAPSITLTSTNSTWSATAPSGYPSSTTFPSGGGFYPKPVHNGSHPVVPSSCNTLNSPLINPGTAKTNANAVAQPVGQVAVKACLSVVNNTPQ
ncbi:MAG TPA: hypothetical protein VJW20_15475 [Candidatus Angelobacter sp.]|nr:hypothetical protein [Candidatus Angelobacter sp.]